MSQTIRIATRKSRLAMVQTNMVAERLKAAVPGVKIEVVPVVSDGCYEKFKGEIATLGGKGAFVKALQQHLLENKADIAVHSMKDVPTDEQQPAGLTFGAVLERGDIRDAVICRTGEDFSALKQGAKVGTSSVRRGAQLKQAFPYFEIVPIRGNVDTRLQKLDDKEVDAVMLARIGLQRLGLEKRIDTVFEPDMLCPAAGQGTIGIECRADDEKLLANLKLINHADTMTCLSAERRMLELLQGNCHTPIGGYCEVTQGGNLRMIACVAALDGSRVVWSRQKAGYNEAVQLGETVAQELLEQGAASLMQAA